MKPLKTGSMKTNIGLGRRSSFSARGGRVNTHPPLRDLGAAAVVAKINVEMFACILWNKMRNIES